MSKEAVYTCDRCGKHYTEVCYEYESRIEMRVSYHWDDISTGHHLKEHEYHLCHQCSKEFAEFMGNGEYRDLSN